MGHFFNIIIFIIYTWAMAWKTWPPKATKWEYNKKTKMVYMYHVIHLNGSHFRKGQKLWTQFPKVFHIYIYIYISLWHGCTRIYDFTKITNTYCRPQKRGICLYLCQIYRDLRAAAVFCPLSSYVLASHMLANGKNGHRFHRVSASLGTEGRRTTADNGHSREARGRRHMSGEPDSKHIPSGNLT